MLALRIRYLTGRCVATSYNDRQRPEWPPHPARLYSALVATWMESEVPDQAERAALEWLAGAGPPAIHASPASHRDVMTHYVPVNDQTVIKGLGSAHIALLEFQEELQRLRQDLDEAKRRGNDNEARKLDQKLQKAEQKYLKKQRDHLSKARAETAVPRKASKDSLKVAKSLVLEPRLVQARSFPSVTPEDPVVTMMWETPGHDRHRDALENLFRRVVRIGHSSSLVSCELGDEVPEPNWFPDDSGPEVLRIPGANQLERLQDAWELHQGTEPRVLPCLFQRYRTGTMADEHEPVSSVFSSDWLIFRRVGGPRLPITRAVDVCQSFRKALLSHSESSVPEELSGHQEDGEPSQRPHVGIFALPFVGHRHADGSILGVGLVLPRDIHDDARRSILRAVGRWESEYRLEEEESPILSLFIPGGIEIELERIPWGSPQLKTLRPETWCEPSRSWLTVTPIALDRNPGNLHARDASRSREAYRTAASIVAHSCENVGLPLPESVTVIPSATVPGTMKARRFPPYPPDGNKLRRVKVHARVTFADPVNGPVVLGAGRYLGLGLCIPMDMGGKR